jgi:hypothetical protein
MLSGHPKIPQGSRGRTQPNHNCLWSSGGKIVLVVFVLNGGYGKAIKATLPNSLVGKNTKTKQVQLWLHQVEVYLETQLFNSNKKWIHFTQTFLE